MTVVDHVEPTARRRPRGGWRWTAAGVVALPAAWALLTVVIGPFGMEPPWVAVYVAVLGVAVCVGLGQRWAHAVVAVLGAAAFTDSTVDPGMLAAVGWVFGALYAAIGIALLVASRPRRATVRS